MTRSSRAWILVLCLTVPAVAWTSAPAGEAEPPITSAAIPAPKLPDVPLVGQDGRTTTLPKLVAGKRVAINFIYTTCSTVCGPMTAYFARLQHDLGEQLGRDVQLVSISIDPRIDTPQRLDEFATRFGRKEGWTFLTGDPVHLREVYAALGAPLGNKTKHPPMVVLGNGSTGQWVRMVGLVPPATLGRELERLGAPAPERLERAQATYFTNTVVTDQRGERHRFYDDLVKGRTVVLQFGFTSCKTACPAMAQKLARVQQALGDRVGRDVNILTLSVDAERDSPEALAEFAQRHGARDGWYLLTAEPKEMAALLRKLGGWSRTPAEHSVGLVVGDTRTGNWLKLTGHEPPERIVWAIEHLND